jgi:hypothetical protein
MNLEEFTKELTSNFGWSTQTLQPSVREWNSYIKNELDTNGLEQAVKLHSARRNSLSRGVASDFQARTSAMSMQGASAYADNWN